MSSIKDSASSAEAKRLSRRRLFEGVASLYDRVRPAYPDVLVEALVAFAELGPKSRVLEIGGGTGQLTVALARCGASITGVELGSDLAARARANLQGAGRCEVIVADFDEWPLPADPFDLVVAANSYHWLDPRSRLKKFVNALRPHGAVAVIEAHGSAGSGRDRFFVESQDCYACWYPDHGDFEPSLPDRNLELEASGYFDGVHLERHVCEQRYSAAEYCELLSTFSDVRELDDASRSGFLRCIETLIVSRFGGCVSRINAYSGWFARKICT